MEIQHPYGPIAPECEGCSRVIAAPETPVPPVVWTEVQLSEWPHGPESVFVDLSLIDEATKISSESCVIPLKVHSACSAYGWPGTWFRNGKRCPLGDHYPKESAVKKAFINPLKLSKMKERGLI